MPAESRSTVEGEVRPELATAPAEGHAERDASHSGPRREQTEAPAIPDKMPRTEAVVSPGNPVPAANARHTQPVEGAHAKEAPLSRTSDVESHVSLARPAAPTASPVRDISLRVAADGAEKIELRVTDRAGEVRVAVRSADPDLAGSLRDHLPELVDRLERSGFETETWRPAPSTSGLSDPRHVARGAAGESFDSPHHGNPQQQTDQRERRQQQSDRSRWFEEIESNVPAAERTPWLQQ